MVWSSLAVPGCWSWLEWRRAMVGWPAASAAGLSSSVVRVGRAARGSPLGSRCGCGLPQRGGSSWWWSGSFHGGGWSPPASAVGERPFSTFDSSPHCPGSTLVIGLDRSQLRSVAHLTPVAARQSSSRARQQDRARLAPGSRTDLVSRPAAGPTSSRARQQDRVRLAPGAAGRVMEAIFGPALWVSAPGAVQGCVKERTFHSSLWLG